MRPLVPLLSFALLSVVSGPAHADEPKPAGSKVEPKAADGDAPLAEGFPAPPIRARSS